MNQNIPGDDQSQDFPFEPSHGEWFDRPADTLIAEREPALVGGSADAEAPLPAPDVPAPDVPIQDLPAQVPPSEWETRFDEGLDPTTVAQPEFDPEHTANTAVGEMADGHDIVFELRPPSVPEGLGISQAVLEDILLRQIVVDVRNNTTALAAKLHVSANLVDVVVQAMRDRNLVEYQGMDGRAYVVSPTESGRLYASQRSSECRYMGPIPVSLGLYHEVVRAQHPNLVLDRKVLSDAFSDLVIAPELLDELGPAIHSDGAMFLYGPPGTGKSSVAERIVRAHEDYVLVPYCIEVEGQIISVYDPTLHTAIDEQPTWLDPRWVACERPAVVTGGELHPGMLDLQYEADSGVYLAPLQLKANNGIFVIDDFGRQSATPEELLNRWIVPLDRGIDYLTLMGRKFEVPFDLKVVLSTNMQPAKLGDDAFFRRIHSKVFVGACSDSEFDEILARVTAGQGIEVAPGAAEHLRRFAHIEGDGELRAYLPGTVCRLASSISAYMGERPVLSPEMIDRVMSLYFTREF
ncbi:MAG: AAA family ATPase [Microthrixaceae bacterium]